MAVGPQQILDDALRLSAEERARLAEKLVESLVTSIDPEIERAHLRAVQERRAEYQAGSANLVEGDEALKHIRAIIRK